MSRDTLHDLVDLSPAYRAALSAAVDADAVAIHQAREDVRTGRVTAHDDVLREFGLR